MVYWNDWFMVYRYKIPECPYRSENHSHLRCWYAHPEHNDQRRNHNDLYYSSLRCPHFTAYGACSDGEECVFAHGAYEALFHPQSYKTRRCTPETCLLPICPFVHDDEEDRTAQVQQERHHHNQLMHHRLQQFLNQPRIHDHNNSVQGSSSVFSHQFQATLSQPIEPQQPVQTMTWPNFGSISSPTRAQMTAEIGVHHPHHHQFEAAAPPIQEHTVDHSLQPVQTMPKFGTVSWPTRTQMTTSSTSVHHQFEAAAPPIQAHTVDHPLQPAQTMPRFGTVSWPTRTQTTISSSVHHQFEAAAPPIQAHTVDHPLQPVQTMPIFGTVSWPMHVQQPFLNEAITSTNDYRSSAVDVNRYSYTYVQMVHAPLPSHFVHESFSSLTVDDSWRTANSHVQQPFSNEAITSTNDYRSSAVNIIQIPNTCMPMMQAPLPSNYAHGSSSSRTVDDSWRTANSHVQQPLLNEAISTTGYRSSAVNPPTVDHERAAEDVKQYQQNPPTVDHQRAPEDEKQDQPNPPTVDHQRAAEDDE